ncbi:RabGAP/TBC domain-containing protein [Heterostelium album PN500]|uniref:RabGAP/TBC domain-containing protein n=1 Tax=Heterostelium pallidum (strain ATCC 26659 / Pp 5 / PN500) TaxID=670386 RepID=D3B6N8_HETP5|nr:RabGAP/TBC domain-containing protein [Heterostelium album PN500]EFA83008.1 RabGAP/TBC domain-containing protein [Heterostelium album PN500]|eukprot:XP_020435125.1 RabGAP/TBC domain-containing protein [Heterostelium album PN500]
MLRLENFWEDECQQPLLRLDRGFIKEEGVDKIIERMGKWRELIGIKDSEITPVVYGTEEPQRIFVLDAERTFQNIDSKAKLVRILNYLNKQFGDYQQGLSYVASFLMLGMDEHQAIVTLEEINKMLPGYWKHEATNFGIEAFTFYHILGDFHPEVKAHLTKHLIDPATFCQRWFSGLCVHCLPFRQLFRFYDQFFENGREFLLRFGISLMGVFSKQLLAANSYNQLYSLLVLDYKVVEISEDQYNAIFDEASNYDISKYDLPTIRQEQFDKHLKARFESSAKALQEVEAIDDCQWCLDNLPELYCIDCAVVICQDCVDDGKGDEHNHTDEHKVITLEEYEDRQAELKKKKTDDDITAKLSNLSI